MMFTCIGCISYESYCMTSQNDSIRGSMIFCEILFEKEEYFSPETVFRISSMNSQAEADTVNIWWSSSSESFRFFLYCWEPTLMKYKVISTKMFKY